ncbi:transposase [Ralstonia solanacearum]|uniref:Transposase n=1 Tax=Ralstonia solanacearum TaxID=305 RepID=A0AAD0S5E2_RALSL|nr:transposase [Ralstonia solanacearum]AXV80427.1 transposase [Ralstonia solanacearum]AXW51574.1 transposase [Ralstonia solanacearum]
MARLPRLSPVDSPVHVLQRGNNRQAVFRADEDYAFYLDTLRMAAREHDFAIHAFALMPNHVHLVGTPKVADSLSRTLQAVGRRYTRYFNAAAGRSGTLWEGRFRSTVLDPAEWVLPMILYVEANAVRAGLVATPEEDRWSTYRHHVGIQSIPWVSDHYCYWRLGNTPFERQSRYRTLWHEGLGSDLIARIRQHVHSGWPLGGEAFLATLARAGGRRVAPLPKGRPPRGPADVGTEVEAEAG